MRVEEIDALLGGEAQKLADKYTSVPLDFMDGYGWAVTQICRLFHDAVPVIRCKECKKNGNNLCPMLFTEMKDADFCSYAERKEE